MIGVDTSVALPLLLTNHENHELATEWARGKELALCGHALVETYSTLTRLPQDNRFKPDDAVRVMDDLFCTPLLLPADDFLRVHRTLAESGISGGATYDGIIGLAARLNQVTLASFDRRAISTYFAVGAVVELVN